MRLFFAALLCLAAVSGAGAVPFQLPGGSPDSLRALVAGDASAAAAYRRVLGQADAALNAAPTPVAVLRCEGLLDRDPLKRDSESALKDLARAEALAWAWTVSGDPRYRDRARSGLLAWAALNRGRGDPIDDTRLEPALRAFDLVAADWAPDERGRVAAWFRQVADAEIAESRAHPGRTTAFNNWNSHRIKIVGLAGLALDDEGYVAFAAAGYRRQLADDLRADGSSFDFEERDAVHYHLYTLEPLLALAEAFRRAGREDLFGLSCPGGGSLQKSVDFALPFVRGERAHAEYLHSKVAFDRERAAAGQAGFKAGRPFEPRAALGMLELYVYFRPEALGLIQDLSASRAAYPDWQTVINRL